MSTLMSTFCKRSLLAVAGAILVQWLPNAGAQERGLGAGGDLVDGVAAVVNEGVVLKSELVERLSLVMQNLSRQQQEAPPEQRRPLPPAAVVEQQVLDQLIVREVQLQRANKVGITVSDDMLNEALSRVAQNLGYTLEELPAVLAGQNIDYTAYRDDSRKDLLIEQLEQRDVVARISITPRELDQCLANSDAVASDRFDYNISHILISVPANATQQEINAAEQRINEVHERLVAGEDFARLAVATSQFRKSYLFHAPTNYDTSYVNIIALTGAAVNLDGQAVTGFTPIGGTGYSVARKSLSKAGTGNHTASSTEGFGISIYGYGQYTSYWYPGGSDLAVLHQ